MAASATFALKAGVWFRRGRLDMVSPDSQATACLPSGRNSTYRLVQNSGTGSDCGGDVKQAHLRRRLHCSEDRLVLCLQGIVIGPRHQTLSEIKLGIKI